MIPTNKYIINLINNSPWDYVKKIALKSKITTKQSLNLIAQLKKNSQKTAFVIMCYLNTVQKFGVQNFIKEIKNVVDGIILVDLPFEEEKSIKNLLDKNNIHLIKNQITN